MQTGSKPWPAPGRAWWAVAALTAIYSLSYANRFAPAIFVEPIKRDLLLSDTQLSLLIGVAFVLFYAAMGLPMARLGDRANRRNILMFAIPIWSGAMAFSGFAENFTQFFIARIILGLGEATIGPLSLSLISDYFPPEKRARPVSIWFVGSSLGTAAAFMIGGLGDYLAGFIGFEPLASLEPWRLAFVALGALGIIAVLVMITIAEPERRDVAGDNAAKENEGTFVETVVYVKQRYKTFAAFFGASAIANVIFNGSSIWFPTLYVRRFNWSAEQAGYVLGAVIITIGIIGPLVVSWLNDYYTRRGRADAAMYTAFVMLLAAITPVVLAPLVTSPPLAAILLFLMVGGVMGSAILPSVAVLNVVPNRLRAQIIALMFLIQNLFGYGLGPTLYAMTTEYVFQDPNKIHFAIALNGTALTLLAIVFLYLGLPRYRRDIASVQDTDTSER